MRVVTYSRVSSAHHDQKPEVQIQELRRYCEARKWFIDEEIVDHGYSGANDLRPGLKRLLSIVRAREVDAVVIVKLDRLFRSLKHLVTLLEEWTALDVVFVATRDNVDYTTPVGRFFVQVMGSLAEFEKSLLRERTIMGLEYAKSIGKRLGRPRLHDPQEIMRLRLQGQSYRSIARQLGVPVGCIARAIKEAARKSPDQIDKGDSIKSGGCDD